ncbi:hypothetical protein [Virgibacillus sp. L01]|uniref:hypothetical protein n=1 Tax=Virgibacillus sp. L01 TaxID=3457429 RepID=UPI003FD68444
MNRKLVTLLMMSMLLILLLAACGSDEEASGSNDKDKDNSTEQEAEKDNSDKEKDDKAEEEKADEETEGAVAPQSSSEEISFRQVSWMMGSPDRRPNAGVWYYTANDHPSKYDDTFKWEKEDILLWQISNKEYQGYDADTELLVKMDNDVIKIVVGLEKDDDPSDKKMPRNFLKVDKGALEGKSFIIETVDGEELSLK